MKNHFFVRTSSWLELTKFKLSFAVALSPVAGYFMFGQIKGDSLFGVFAGTLLLALGVAALNQYQERHSDSMMDRTRNRPIPSGEISSKETRWTVIMLLILGTVVLGLTTTWVTTALGLITAAWYNLVYTPLKKRSAFAVIPGGVCGALPPVMGWTAAGGELLHPKIVVLSLFFFVWQIPHFWLILLKYGQEYTKAGLPSVTAIWNQKQLKGITFIWMLTTGVSALLLPALEMISVGILKILLVVFTFTYFYFTYQSLYKSGSKVNFRMAFIAINMFLISVMLLLIVQQFLK
ncbi:MAG: protoheme IX farnesyltransferase [Salinivirgaceae bacterium]|nr:protoheme IX farnesyltransferase [Salinivirgaceae bacterium]